MAAVNEELVKFVKESLKQNITKVEIKDALLDANWPADQVKNALNTFADINFPVPVPKPHPYISARETFFYLLLFATLMISAFNLGNLIFQLIERALPDPVNLFNYPRSDRTIRWAISFIVISFPIFLYLTFRMQRAIKIDPTKRGSKIRKWLTYLTLFIAAGFVIGDLTTLVYNLLGGELTLRFILKVLTVGLIAGSIFGYYLWDIHQDEQESE